MSSSSSSLSHAPPCYSHDDDDHSEESRCFCTRIPSWSPRHRLCHKLPKLEIRRKTESVCVVCCWRWDCFRFCKLLIMASIESGKAPPLSAFFALRNDATIVSLIFLQCSFSPFSLLSLLIDISSIHLHWSQQFLSARCTRWWLQWCTTRYC